LAGDVTSSHLVSDLSSTSPRSMNSLNLMKPMRVTRLPSRGPPSPPSLSPLPSVTFTLPLPSLAVCRLVLLETFLLLLLELPQALSLKYLKRSQRTNLTETVPLPLQQLLQSIPLAPMTSRHPPLLSLIPRNRKGLRISSTPRRLATNGLSPWDSTQQQRPRKHPLMSLLMLLLLWWMRGREKRCAIAN
jgi:hypothetical protein